MLVSEFLFETGVKECLKTLKSELKDCFLNTLYMCEDIGGKDVIRLEDYIL